MTISEKEGLKTQKELAKLFLYKHLSVWLHRCWGSKAISCCCYEACEARRLLPGHFSMTVVVENKL